MLVLCLVNLGNPENLFGKISVFNAPLEVLVLHLPTVPVPLVDLRLLQIQQIRQSLHLLFAPLGVLTELTFENAHLVVRLHVAVLITREVYIIRVIFRRLRGRFLFLGWLGNMGNLDTKTRFVRIRRGGRLGFCLLSVQLVDVPV